MKILITGGAGFVGSNLAKRLIDDGHQVICLDNFLTGRKENIEELLKNKNFELVEHDIVEPIDMEVDQIYNLACPASPPHYQKDPIRTTKTCVLGMINALEIAKKNKAKILQASTSEVYGDPEEHPQKESYRGSVNTIGPRSCYDEGKRLAETLCFDYYRQHQVDIRVVRIFNTYGPKMDPQDGRVISNFIVQALQGQDITIYGDGQQTRSFCYVDDLVEALIKMMSQDDFKGPVNLGNPAEFTINDLAKKVLAMIDSNSNLVHMDLPTDDPKLRNPDISLAREKLGWEPKVNLEEGLKKTIEYFKKVV